MQSDLLVSIGGVEYSVHKFPLYSKTDYFSRIAKDDEASGKTHVEVVGLPGTEHVFKLVANFCYGLSLNIDPSNIAQLRCAGELQLPAFSYDQLCLKLQELATYLHMDDDTRSGMGYEGNLVSWAEQYLQEYLKDWRKAAIILQACGTLQPIATNLGLVSRCVDALTAASAQQYKEEALLTEPIFMAQPILDLQLDMFKRLTEGLRENGVPEADISRLIEAYGHRWLPDLTQLLVLIESSQANTSKFSEWRNTLEVLAQLLPRDKSAISMAHILRLLRMSMALKTSKDSRSQLHKRAGEHFNQANVADLLLLEISDVQGLVTRFISEEHVSMLSEAGKAVQAAAALVDSYLQEASKDVKGVNIVSFKSLATCLPPESRPSHDALYWAIASFVDANGQTLTAVSREHDLLDLLNILSAARFSEAVAEHASKYKAWPLPFVADVLVWQKLYYREKADLVVKRHQGLLEACQLAAVDNTKLKQASEELQARLKTAEATVVSARASLREETQEVTEELVKFKNSNNELDGLIEALKHKSLCPSDITPAVGLGADVTLALT
eukprot:SM000022S07248  [mRNA]  locus=s22:699227:704156:- [translate_table: standard]